MYSSLYYITYIISIYVLHYIFLSIFFPTYFLVCLTIALQRVLNMNHTLRQIIVFKGVSSKRTKFKQTAGYHINKRLITKDHAYAWGDNPSYLWHICTISGTMKCFVYYGWKLRRYFACLFCMTTARFLSHGSRKTWINNISRNTFCVQKLYKFGVFFLFKHGWKRKLILFLFVFTDIRNVMILK